MSVPGNPQSAIRNPHSLLPLFPQFLQRRRRGFPGIPAILADTGLSRSALFLLMRVGERPPEGSTADELRPGMPYATRDPHLPWLEEAIAANLLARDEAGRSYDVQTTGQVVSKPGWFKKVVTLGMAKGKTTVPVRLTLRVTAEGDGSKVSAEGATDDASRAAAQALLETLKQRLS